MILFAELPPLPIALDHVLVSIKKKKKKAWARGVARLYYQEEY